MKARNNGEALVIALIVAVGLFMVVGGGAMTGTGRGMMAGPAWMSGVGGMWIPAVLTAGLGAWLVWRIVRR